MSELNQTEKEIHAILQDLKDGESEESDAIDLIKQEVGFNE